MSMRVAGTHLISWAQTWLDGENPQPGAPLTEGALWRWFGVPLRIDGPQGAMLLGQEIGRDALQRRAHNSVRKMFRTHGTAVADIADDPDPLFDGGFIVTDGARFYTLMTVEGADPAGPLIVFYGPMPPANVQLTIVQVAVRRRARKEGGAVVCFTPGTLISTDKGRRAVEDLFPGDMVMTKDNGAQEIQWMGLRQVSGARMHISPDLRPVRIRAGALGHKQPQPDLIVSPEHRILMTGRKAQMLFNTPEVLVRAADLVDDRHVLIDHTCTETVYVHLMFANHEVIWANGVETESFHPGLADLSHLNIAEAEELEEVVPGVTARPDLYGPHARRCLSPAELAILRYESVPHYLT